MTFDANFASEVRRVQWQNSDAEAIEAANAASQSALSLVSQQGPPIGAILAYAGVGLHVGNWMFCHGQELSRQTYGDLFFAIGTEFGVGDGSTTFNLPDLRGRVPAGQDDMGGVSANRLTSPINGDTLGAVGGAESVASSAQSGSFSPGTTREIGVSEGTGIFVMDSTNTVVNSPGAATSVVQPTLIVNYIIRTS